MVGGPGLSKTKTSLQIHREIIEQLEGNMPPSSSFIWKCCRGSAAYPRVSPSRIQQNIFLSCVASLRATRLKAVLQSYICVPVVSKIAMGY